MGSRRPNPKLVKIHRNYTVDEIARLFGVHKNTVRMWIKVGLATIDRRRPTLIHGFALRAFIEERRGKSKQRCRPGEIYCVCCRSPKVPAGGMVDYLEITTTSGNLSGICPDCGHLIYRRVALGRLQEVAVGLEVGFPQAPRRIGESDNPSVNCDSSKDHRIHEDAQS